jgi:DNA-directed RNA polymerase I, II, and III subunit RPABC3
MLILMRSVSRIIAQSNNLSMSLTLDIANELYPLVEGDIFSLAIARNLVPEEAGADDEEEEAAAGGAKRVKKELWRSEDQGLAADYEYVMFGKVCFLLLEGVCRPR